MWLLGAEYEEASGWAIPASQAGAEKRRGCPEQSLVMRFQKEQCAAERTVCCRAYLDFGVFFMSCVREVQWAVEKWCKVKPGVTKTVQAMNKGMKGRYETAYGMTDTFEVERGNGHNRHGSSTRQGGECGQREEMSKEGRRIGKQRGTGRRKQRRRHHTGEGHR